MEKEEEHFAALRWHKKKLNRPFLLRHKSELKWSTYLKHWVDTHPNSRREDIFDEIQNIRKILEGKTRKEQLNKYPYKNNKEWRIDNESDEKKNLKEVSKDDKGELMKHLVIKKDEDIAIDAIPLATNNTSGLLNTCYHKGLHGTLSVDKSR
ncbi:hypothetical protein Tco_0335212 [Tanacetum coccineum]